MPDRLFLPSPLITNVLVCTLLIMLPAGSSWGQDLDSERFTYVLHDSLEAHGVAHLAEALEENYERIKRNLQVESLPLIRVQIWTDNDAYQDAMEEAFGMRFPGSRGYVYGAAELRMLFNNGEFAARELVHEFVHAVSLTLNPAFGNNPRWLWEAVAQYEAGEFRDPKSVPYLMEGRYPGLDELDQGFNSGRNIYDVGYVLVEYIIATWSRDILIELIRSNGDIEGILDVNSVDFETGWHQYLRDTYLSSTN